MAKYDYGGGCPCGLEAECPPSCRHYKPSSADYDYGGTWRPNKLKRENEVMKLDESDDFGFTFIDSNEIESKVKTTEDKLQGLRKMIMPLLNNLMKNPEKDTILWPNRDKKIKEFIKKMDEYINT